MCAVSSFRMTIGAFTPVSPFPRACFCFCFCFCLLLTNLVPLLCLFCFATFVSSISVLILIHLTERVTVCGCETSAHFCSFCYSAGGGDLSIMQWRIDRL
jgi:hypothetical protein